MFPNLSPSARAAPSVPSSRPNRAMEVGTTRQTRQLGRGHERERRSAKVDKACRMTGALYGAAWNIDFDRPEPGLFEMKVNRCFFRDFFTRHDVPLVTTVLCAWDVNFMRAIDPAVSGLRAERTSLMSLG